MVFPELFPAELIGLAVERLGCTMLEVRLRRTRGDEIATRVTIAGPDPEAIILVAALAEALGAKLESRPAFLALGIGLPDAPTVTFWLQGITGMIGEPTVTLP